MGQIDSANLPALVQLAQSGEVGAFCEIVRRFQNMAVGYAYSLLKDFHSAEDASQEAFLQAWRDLGSLENVSAFPLWLKRIIFKKCNRQTRRKRVKTVELNEAMEVMSNNPNPAESAMRSEMQRNVAKAIEDLPQLERSIVALFYIDEYSQKEIAEFLGVPASTVNNRLASSRKQLKARMMNMVDDMMKSHAPEPEKLSERVAFLLGFAKMLAEGVNVGGALKHLEGEMKSAEMKEAIARLYDGVCRPGVTLTAAMKDCGDIFPPMVLSLVWDGEDLGMMDVTIRMAGQWMATGKYEMDPFLYPSAWNFPNYLRDALADGAKELVVDTRRTHTYRARWMTKEEAYVWVEHLMPDGERKWAVPLCSKNGFNQNYPHSLLFQLKGSTIFDSTQEGDTMRGRLRIRVQASDDMETLFPITFCPYRDGDEIRIRLREYSL